MNMTPLDAEKERFRSGFRGYARDDVERFRAQAIAALEEHIALESQLKARIIDLEARLTRHREMEDLVRDSVVLAQRTCDELIAAAHQQADSIKHEARLEGSRIRGELADLRAQREQFEYAFYGLLTGFQHRLVQGNPALATGADRPAELPDSRRVDAAASGLERSVFAPPQLLDASPAEAGASPPVPPRVATAVTATAPPNMDTPPAPAAGTRETQNRQLFSEMPAVRSPAAPDVPEVPAPRHPAVVAHPAGGGDIDRDADIADFSAVLAEAGPDPQSAWPGPDAAGPGSGLETWPSLLNEEQPAETLPDQSDQQSR